VTRRLDDLQNGRYPGGKNAGGTWQWIAAKFPTHSLYVEPFAGSFAVGRRKPPALRSIAIDADPGVVAWLEKLPGVEAIHGCGIEWLETVGHDLAADAVVYCDPPYAPDSPRRRRSLPGPSRRGPRK
jgi:DNA adenine methylase